MAETAATAAMVGVARMGRTAKILAFSGDTEAMVVVASQADPEEMVFSSTNMGASPTTDIFKAERAETEETEGEEETAAAEAIATIEPATVGMAVMEV